MREFVVKGNDFSNYDNNSDFILDKVDKNGTHYYHVNKCPKCGGSGWLREYDYVEGGICFLCNGSGTYLHNYKVMTEAYNHKLCEKRLLKVRKEAAAKNKDFLCKMGFSTDGNAWVVLGNTYPIRDELKVAGAKFDNWLGWHFAEEQEKYPTVMVNIGDKICDDLTLVEIDENTGTYSMAACYIVGDWIKTIKGRKEAELKAMAGITNDYYGEKGQHIIIKATLVKTASFDTHYTYYGETTWVHTFEDGYGHIFVWKTSRTSLDEFKSGIEVELKGTIKAHSEFRGVKQTELTRCKISA